MKNLRLPNWEGGELPVWPPHQPPDPAAVAPVLGGDPRLSTNRWWEVREEQVQAAEERDAPRSGEREAKTLENYQGPRWWERGRA
jgi:hypothetical protein